MSYFGDSVNSVLHERLEAIAFRLEAIASGLDANASGLEAIAIRPPVKTTRLVQRSRSRRVRLATSHVEHLNTLLVNGVMCRTAAYSVQAMKGCSIRIAVGCPAEF